MSQQCGKK